MKLMRAHNTNTGSVGAPRRRSRAQAMIEMAMIFPILMLLFGILVDAGLALNAWIRVNTAARDSTRFVLDAGSNTDIISMVTDKLQDLSSDPIDIYVIKGLTSNSGQILDSASPYWGVSHIYGASTSGSGVVSSTIQSQLSYASDTSAANGVSFAIVEVQLTYSPLLPSLISPNLKIPMNSYAIVQLPSLSQ